MSKKNNIHIKDLHGLAKVGQDAVVHASHVIEDFQRRIIHPPLLPSTPIQGFVSAISAAVHKTLRFTARRVGSTLQDALNLLDQEQPTGIRFGNKRAMLAIANGVFGDYLLRNNNPLAQPMQVKFQETPLTPANVATALHDHAASGKIVLLVHGLCMDDAGWTRNDHNHGTALADAFGMTPLFLHYNTGLHISENGASLSDALESLLVAWPVPVQELVIVAHSMGGLVSRSAVALGQQDSKTWVHKLKKIIFLGTPHHGTSLEKVGNYVHALLDALPYTKPLAKLGGLRSAGISDLRFGNLVAQDWNGQDRFAAHKDARQPLPLPPQVSCFAIAATLGQDEADLKTQLAGDGLVPLDSALGRHKHPKHQLTFADTHTLHSVGHMDLLSDQNALAVMQNWLQH
ncbi:MAG: alpha/beta hydrolase [Bacteroidetes bacterium]|nr:alpha/beta hydrolase [Bacteroidota bacterium]